MQPIRIQGRFTNLSGAQSGVGEVKVGNLGLPSRYAFFEYGVNQNETQLRPNVVEIDSPGDYCTSQPQSARIWLRRVARLILPAPEK